MDLPILIQRFLRDDEYSGTDRSKNGFRKIQSGVDSGCRRFGGMVTFDPDEETKSTD